jgi:4-amino-4-deoxychorismate lyase
MSHWYSRGKRSDTVPAADRGAQYGDGLFETIAIRDGTPRFWQLHVERLELGCDRLGLAMPREDMLRTEIDAALAHGEVDSHRAVAKVVISAGVGSRGYRRHECGPPSVRIGLFASPALAPDYYEDGVAVRMCRTRLAQQPCLAGIKSLNRLEQVLARNEWDDPAVFEGLMLDTDDRLICGTMSNVFICSGNSVITPPITRCGVSGVMRRQVLAELTTHDQHFEVRDIEVAELLQADEVFVSNSQFGVLPVRGVDSTEYSVGPVTQKVMKLLARAGVAECSI